MIQILCADPRPPVLVELMRRLLPGGTSLDIVPTYDERDFARLAAEAEVLLVMARRVDAHLLSMTPRLRLVQRNGVGYDNIDVGALNLAGIPAAYTPGANARAVAEHTIMLMLVMLKRFAPAIISTQAGQWPKMHFAGQGLGDLSGCAVGLVGFGHVAQTVAEMLQAFNARVIYTGRRRADPAVEASLRMTYMPLAELLAASDIVSLHVALAEDTFHMMSDDAFSRMRRGAILINTSRGGLVDEAALRRAIESGQIGGAGLDCIETEREGGNVFADLPQVVVTPHLAGLSRAAIEGVLARSMTNIARFVAGEPLLDPIPGTILYRAMTGAG